MAKLEDLEGKPSKMAPENRRDYLRARGFIVTIEGSYERTRRVRAATPEDAMAFAEAREAQYAPQYFRGQGHTEYKVLEITAIDVTEVEDG